MKRSQQSKEQPSSSSKREGQSYISFFEGALLPSMGAGRAGIHSRTHPRALSFGKGNRGGVVGHTTTLEARGAKTKTTTGRSESTSTEEALKLLTSLPGSDLKKLGVNMDLRVVEEEVNRKQHLSVQCSW